MANSGYVSRPEIPKLASREPRLAQRDRVASEKLSEEPSNICTDTGRGEREAACKLGTHKEEFYSRRGPPSVDS